MVAAAISSVVNFFCKLAVSLLALTKTTHLAARLFGARPFLPALWKGRMSLVGGLPVSTIIAQLDRCTSLDDGPWTDYWSQFAEEYLTRIASDEMLRCAEWVAAIRNGRLDCRPPRELLDSLASGAWLLNHHNTLHAAVGADSLGSGFSTSQIRDACTVDALWKSLTYYFCASWPGKTARRQGAYYQSRAVFDVLLDGVAASLNIRLERDVVEVEGERTSFYALFPLNFDPRKQKLPAIFIGNGLEGNDQEMILPLLRIFSGRNMPDVAFFIAEMPGTYAFSAPICPPARAEQIYDALYHRILAHPGVNSQRFGIVGISFSANCAARTVARDAARGEAAGVIKAAVINGLPNTDSFHPSGTLGIPQIMIETLQRVSGASNPLGLLFRLRQLIIKPEDFAQIRIPLLVINGDNDTLCATSDSVKLARQAGNAQLKLYTGDDHCAIDHLEEHLKLSVHFLLERM